MLTSAGKGILKVSLLDISPHNKAILEFFFSGAGRHLFKLSDDDGADVFIADFDYPGAKQNWLDNFANKNKPVLVISFHETDIEQAVWLSKPLTSQALTEAAGKIRALKSGKKKISLKPAAIISAPVKTIKPKPAPVSKPLVSNKAKALGESNTVEKQVKLVDAVASEKNQKAVRATAAAEQPQQKKIKKTEAEVATKPDVKQQDARWKMLCGDAPDIQNPAVWHMEMALYTPENHLISSLLDALRLARQSQQMVQLSYQKNSIYLIPKYHQAYCPVDVQSEAFHTLCNTPINKHDVSLHIMSSNEIEKAMLVITKSKNDVYDLEGFIWTSTLLSSAGKLQRNVEIRRTVGLKHWPNFTRLEDFPHVMRIAALWSAEPSNLLEMAHKLNIPQRYVFAFYNAANAIGLMEYDSSKLKARKKSKSQEKSRGLFSRLLQRLIGN